MRTTTDGSLNKIKERDSSSASRTGRVDNPERTTKLVDFDVEILCEFQQLSVIHTSQADRIKRDPTSKLRLDLVGPGLLRPISQKAADLIIRRENLHVAQPFV